VVLDHILAPIVSVGGDVIVKKMPETHKQIRFQVIMLATGAAKGPEPCKPMKRRFIGGYAQY
jgi:hypothetical protein